MIDSDKYRIYFENCIKREEKEKINQYGKYELRIIGPILADLINLVYEDDEKFVFSIVKCSNGGKKYESAVIVKENKLKPIYESSYISDECVSLSSGNWQDENGVLSDEVVLAKFNEGFYHPLLASSSIRYSNFDFSLKKDYWYEVDNNDWPLVIKDFILYVTYYRLRYNLEEIKEEKIVELEQAFLKEYLDYYRTNRESIKENEYYNFIKDGFIPGQFRENKKNEHCNFINDKLIRDKFSPDSINKQRIFKI